MGRTLRAAEQAATVYAVDSLGHRSGGEVILRPVVLQRGNASTIGSAVDLSLSCLSPEKVTVLAEQIAFLIWAENPDGCSANRRKRRRLPPDHQTTRCAAGRTNCMESVFDDTHPGVSA